VQLGQVEGFMPYKQLAATTIRKGHTGDLSYLVGQKINARVVLVSALFLQTNDGCGACVMRSNATRMEAAALGLLPTH
jgi:hypothetical protein